MPGLPAPIASASTFSTGGLLAETLRRTGSYDSILYGLAGVVAILGIGSWRVAMPSREASARIAAPQVQPAV